jgi:hypothetical protein
MKKILSLALLAPLAMVAACSSSDENVTPTDTGVADTNVGDTAADTNPGDTATDTPVIPPRVQACKDVITAKKAKFATELASWKTDDLDKMTASKNPPKDSGGNVVGEGHTLYAGRYRDDLTQHPGCSPRTAYDGKLFLNSKNEATVAPGTPASIPGYTCAAKEYTMPTGVTVDATKPIVILVHGNSANPNSWEEFKNSALTDADSSLPGVQLKTASAFEFTVDTTTREQLASKLVKKGYRVIAVDFRTEKTATLTGAALTAGTTDPGFGDAIGNVDHGWSVPILQSLIASVMKANPTAKVAIVGHSLGYTVIQDSLRRMYKAHKADSTKVNPFAQLKTVVLASGAAHGVANGAYNCTKYATMRGSVNCEMGDRANWVATDFNKINNGPGDIFATPCADGDFAYGDTAACGGNVVDYTTITMKDAATLQDEFVSVATSRLDMDKNQVLADGTIKVLDPACVDNHLIELTDYDSSGYFMDGLPGFLANHFGSIRSDNGMAFIQTKL